jgi:hypothetical protein
MKKVALVVGMMLLLPMAARAQKNEIFLGYSLNRFDAKPSDVYFGGWEASYTYKFTSYVGITGDVDGDYGSVYSSRTNYHSYLGGLTFYLPLRKFTPYAHGLVGGSHLSMQSVVSGCTSYTFGGGVDYTITRHVAARLFQYDYLRTHFTQTSSDGRISFGIVFHF